MNDNDEERGATGGTPYSRASINNSVLTDRYLSKGAVDEDNYAIVLIKKKMFGKKSQKQMEHHTALLKCYSTMILKEGEIM